MPKIETAGTYYRHLMVRTQADAAAYQARKIAKLKDEDIQCHDDPQARVARVDLARWIIDCECGAGVAVHPEWTAGYCFDCGAICTNVQFPSAEERADIEATLSDRKWKNRFFLPERGETVETLKRENVENGIPVKGK